MTKLLIISVLTFAFFAMSGSRGQGTRVEQLAAAKPAEHGKARETVIYEGKYYRDATIWIFGAQRVKIESPKDGTAVVPLNALPPSMLAEVNAWKGRRAAAEQKEAREVEAQKSGELHAALAVLQRLPDGLLCRYGDTTVKLVGHPKEKELVDNDSTTVRALPGGTYQYKDIMGALRTVRVYRVVEVTK